MMVVTTIGGLTSVSKNFDSLIVIDFLKKFMLNSMNSIYRVYVAAQGERH